jgi:hypothetical protein
MDFGTWAGKDLICRRCHTRIEHDIVYRNGEYYHPRCYERGLIVLGRAMALAKNAVELAKLEAEKESQRLGKHGVDILYPEACNDPPSFNSD